MSDEETPPCPYCIRFPTCVEGEKTVCKEHCKIKSHNHCHTFMCDGTVEVIKPIWEKSFCKKCCSDKNHGHCIEFLCTNPQFDEDPDIERSCRWERRDHELSLIHRKKKIYPFCEDCMKLKPQLREDISNDDICIKCKINPVHFNKKICAKCCTKKEHNHCVKKGCGEKPHRKTACLNDDHCVEHCIHSKICDDIICFMKRWKGNRIIKGGKKHRESYCKGCSWILEKN